MKILIPDYFNKFICSGCECPNTCCRGWSIDIDEKSIENYSKIEGVLGDKLKQCIDTKKNRFILEEGVCPFLNQSKLCEIHTELGHDKLCYTCRTYPRIRKDYNDLSQWNLALSCPEAAKIVISSENMITFQYEECEEQEYRASLIIKKVPYPMFDLFFNIQSISIDIMQTKDISLRKRLLANTLFIKNMQKTLDKNAIKESEHMISQYSNPEYMNLMFNQLDQIKVEDLLYVDLSYLLLRSEICLRMMSKVERSAKIYNTYIKDMSRDWLMNTIKEHEHEFELYMKERCYEYENYYVYMIYELYMGAMKDKNIQKVNVMVNVGFALIKLIGLLTWLDQNKELNVEDHALIISSYVKAFLHGKQVFDDIYRLLSSTKYSQINYQVGYIRTGL